MTDTQIATQLDDVPQEELNWTTEELLQLRANILKLKGMTNTDELKAVSHFNIGSFFPLGQKTHKYKTSSKKRSRK